MRVPKCFSDLENEELGNRFLFIFREPECSAQVKGIHGENNSFP